MRISCEMQSHGNLWPRQRIWELCIPGRNLERNRDFFELIRPKRRRRDEKMTISLEVSTWNAKPWKSLVETENLRALHPMEKPRAKSLFFRADSSKTSSSRRKNDDFARGFYMKCKAMEISGRDREFESFASHGETSSEIAIFSSWFVQNVVVATKKWASGSSFLHEIHCMHCHKHYRLKSIQSLCIGGRVWPSPSIGICWCQFLNVSRFWSCTFQYFRCELL